MPICPDTDALVALSRVGDDPLAVARHVETCPDCSRMLRATRIVRRGLEPTAEPRPGFVDEVVDGISPGQPDFRGSPAMRVVWRAAAAVLAGGTAVLVSAAAGSAVASPGGSTVVLGAVLAALATVAMRPREGRTRA